VGCVNQFTFFDEDTPSGNLLRCVVVHDEFDGVRPPLKKFMFRGAF